MTWWVRASLAAWACAICSPAIAAQPPAPAARAHSVDAARVVAGRVRRPVASGGDSTGMGPATRSWVTLHRVGKDSAGPLDSVRTDEAGRYRITWRPFGATDAVYFAAVTWGGIAYFTAPLRSAMSVGDDAEITVFDTTSRVFPLSIKGRHLIVGALDTNNTRTIIEVFELSNDSLQTLVTRERATPSPTWSVAIPEAATEVRITPGEVAPDAFGHAVGRVSIFAPIAPGLKQLAFSYHLPAASFPVNIRAEHGAVVFEILLEEEQGTVRGPGFTAVEDVTIEQRKFRRFLAQDTKPGSTVTVELPVTRSLGRRMYVAAVLVAIGFVVLLILMRIVQRRAARESQGVVTPAALRAIAHARRPEPPAHDRLAHEIAALDATFARLESPSESVRRTYDDRRRELKEALADAMATAGNA